MSKLTESLFSNKELRRELEERVIEFANKINKTGKIIEKVE